MIEELVEVGAFNGTNFCLSCMVSSSPPPPPPPHFPYLLRGWEGSNAEKRLSRPVDR